MSSKWCCITMVVGRVFVRGRWLERKVQKVVLLTQGKQTAYSTLRLKARCDTNFDNAIVTPTPRGIHEWRISSSGHIQLVPGMLTPGAVLCACMCCHTRQHVLRSSQQPRRVQEYTKSDCCVQFDWFMIIRSSWLVVSGNVDIVTVYIHEALADANKHWRDHAAHYYVQQANAHLRWKGYIAHCLELRELGVQSTSAWFAVLRLTTASRPEALIVATSGSTAYIIHMHMCLTASAITGASNSAKYRIQVSRVCKCVRTLSITTCNDQLALSDSLKHRLSVAGNIRTCYLLVCGMSRIYWVVVVLSMNYSGCCWFLCIT